MYEHVGTYVTCVGTHTYVCMHTYLCTYIYTYFGTRRTTTVGVVTIIVEASVKPEYVSC